MIISITTVSHQLPHPELVGNGWHPEQRFPTSSSWTGQPRREPASPDRAVRTTAMTHAGRRLRSSSVMRMTVQPRARSAASCCSSVPSVEQRRCGTDRCRSGRRPWPAGRRRRRGRSIGHHPDRPGTPSAAGRPSRGVCGSGARARSRAPSSRALAPRSACASTRRALDLGLEALRASRRGESAFSSFRPHASSSSRASRPSGSTSDRSNTVRTGDVTRMPSSSTTWCAGNRRVVWTVAVRSVR